MCARKSKPKKFSHLDCSTCHESNGSNNGAFAPKAVSKTNVPPNANLEADPTPTIIYCPKILKVADKDVEVSDRPSMDRGRTDRPSMDRGRTDRPAMDRERTDRSSMDRERRRSMPYEGNTENRLGEDSEDLRRKAFQLYKQYLQQKQGNSKLPFDICPPPVEPKCPEENRYYEEDSCYDPSFNTFLVIVFMILFVMLLITTGFIFVVIKTDWLRDIFRDYALFFIIPALILIVIMNCTMACSPCSRVLPCNFLYLLFAVAAMSIVLSVITVMLDTSLILLIYATTAVVVFFFILLACSPFDFTKWILYVIAMVLALLAIWGLLVVGRKYLNVSYGPAQLFLAIISSLMNVLILVIELQLILSGRSMDLDESEFATGAYLLYTSILELCFNLVQATGVLEEEKDDMRV